MNTAVHDGYDLGWKLAWSLNGWASSGLLDSYELERRPVAEHNVARSADPKGSLRSTEDELRTDLGGRVAHHWVNTPSGRSSTLDLLVPDSRSSRARTANAGATPLKLFQAGRRSHSTRSTRSTARALGILAGGALLVRPRRHPSGWWSGHASPRPLLETAIAGARGPATGRAASRA